MTISKGLEHSLPSFNESDGKVFANKSIVRYCGGGERPADHVVFGPPSIRMWLSGTQRLELHRSEDFSARHLVYPIVPPQVFCSTYRCGIVVCPKFKSYPAQVLENLEADISNRHSRGKLPIFCSRKA